MPTTRVRGRSASAWDDVYHLVLTRSWWSFLGVAFALYLVINVAFATVYALAPGSIASARAGNFEDAFYFSVQTMATIGYGGMTPATRFAHVVVTVEALVGIMYTALLTGLTFSKFARPRAKVLFSKVAVIQPRNGVPHLCFRMANWRHNLVLEAQLRVILLVLERTTEGDVMRLPMELKLVRDRTALFAMTWTAMHRIDETSPFSADGALERLSGEGAELYLSLTGFDETVMQTVHARYRYKIADIVPGARFADVVQINADGSREIDYELFHDVVPIEPALPERVA